MDSSDNVNVIAVEAELEAALANPRYYAEQSPALGPSASGVSWAPVLEGYLKSLTGAVGAGILAGETFSSADPINTVAADSAGFDTSRAFTHMSDVINSSDINKMPTPSQKTKRASGIEIQTDVKRKKTSVKQTPQQANKTVASSTLSTTQSYYDSHLLQGAGEKRLTRLNVKLGKQLYPDLVTPFLKNLCGKGVIRMQFAGRCVSDVGKRHNHIQMFRHRLAQGSGYNQGTLSENGYPTAMKNNILQPASSTNFYPCGPATGAANPTYTHFSTGDTSFRDIVNNQTYWAPYNLADLEDSSWNLNALKMYPPNFLSGGNPTKIVNNVPNFQPKNHYRMSFLAYNNSHVATSSIPGTYKYKAVLNKGSICYDFLNKGTGGAKVEVVIYRVKKQQTLHWTPADQDYVNKSLYGPIGAGYMDTCMAAAGTDDLGGRTPLVADIFDNAAYPFLPKLKATKQGTQPFVEVTRQTFAMPAGARREVNIELPGLNYDPMNQQRAGLASSGGALGQQSVFDEYTYGAMISCCGVVCTNEMKDSNINEYFNVGDIISRCDIQFYGTYTEHIGACQYSTNDKPIQYSAGTMIENATVTNLTPQPTTILSAEKAIRTPATNNNSQGLNLNYDFTTV